MITVTIDPFLADSIVDALQRVAQKKRMLHQHREALVELYKLLLLEVDLEVHISDVIDHIDRETSDGTATEDQN